MDPHIHWGDWFVRYDKKEAHKYALYLFAECAHACTMTCTMSYLRNNIIVLQSIIRKFIFLNMYKLSFLLTEI